MRLSLFPKQEIRQFNLKPRYYDEHKERIAKAREKARQELGHEQEAAQRGYDPDDIRGAFKSSVDRTRAGKQQMMNIALIAGALLIGAIVFVHYAL